MLVERINVHSVNKPYSINYTGRFTDYGTPALLPEHLQVKLAQIRRNYMEIRDLGA